MFGFDKLFDFNGDGKLDAFERAAEMGFLYEEEKEYSKHKKTRRYDDFYSDNYDDDDDRYVSRWDDD